MTTCYIYHYVGNVFSLQNSVLFKCNTIFVYLERLYKNIYIATKALITNLYDNRKREGLSLKLVIVFPLINY